MLIVGLTGGIATGKSSATAFLRAEGVRVIDMDDVARVVVQPGWRALSSIRREFGDSVLLPDGTLDRAELGKRIFADPMQRRVLNRLMQVPLATELLRQLGASFAAGCAVVVVDAPLLFEAGLHRLTRRIIVVAAPESVQLERLMARDSLSAEEAAARIRSQMPLADKVARADFIVDNGGDRAASRSALRDAWGRVLAEAPSSAPRWAWARLPRARGLAASMALWLVLCALRLAGQVRPA